MKGSPAKMGTISGTAGHSSALKMVTEQRAASALKSKEYDAAAKKDPKLGEYVAERKKIKAKYGGDRKKYRASEEYKANQSKINKAYGIDDGYKAPEKAVTLADRETASKKEEALASAETDKIKITEKAAKRTGEVVENVDKRVAKIDKKAARRKYGRGSKEHLEAKKKHLEEKAADIQGGKGGRKRGLFRGLATKINLRKQKKTQAKIDKKTAEENEMKEV